MQAKRVVREFYQEALKEALKNPNQGPWSPDSAWLQGLATTRKFMNVPPIAAYPIASHPDCLGLPRKGFGDAFQNYPRQPNTPR
jgi:hypothetical protein